VFCARVSLDTSNIGQSNPRPITTYAGEERPFLQAPLEVGGGRPLMFNLYENMKVEYEEQANKNRNRKKPQLVIPNHITNSSVHTP
jgi:hypothetical protein